MRENIVFDSFIICIKRKIRNAYFIKFLIADVIEKKLVRASLPHEYQFASDDRHILDVLLIFFADGVYSSLFIRGELNEAEALTALEGIA